MNKKVFHNKYGMSNVFILFFILDKVSFSVEIL